MTFITTNDLRSSRGSYSMERHAIQAFLRKLNGVITEEQYREREGILLGSFSYRPCSTRNSGARFQRRWRRGIRVSVARSLELARQLVQYQSRGTHAQFLLGLLELSDLLGRPAVPGSARMREIDSATPSAQTEYSNTIPPGRLACQDQPRQTTPVSLRQTAAWATGGHWTSPMLFPLATCLQC
jgi:hypothetical protein